MTRFMQKSFSVAVGTSQAARDGWDRCFGNKKPQERLAGLFQVQWDAEADGYVARYEGHPGLSVDAASPEAALRELVALVHACNEED